MTECGIGIDLGTTNSCVAVFQNGKVDIIENLQSSRVTPSWVTFTENLVLTGTEAIDEAHKYPQTTVFEAKRLIGQRFSDPKVQADIDRFPYIVFNDLETPKIRIGLDSSEPREYYPEEIGAYILHTLKKTAETRLNKNIKRVVVTVPAYFNNRQREATKDAARIAGFEHINIINEPTAAALAFNLTISKNQKRNILVYDFGGGTFDVSVVSINNNKCDVKATKGDPHLGGTDIDTILMNYIKADLIEKFGYDIVLKNDALIRRLKNACEKAKKILSGSQFITSIDLDRILPSQDYSIQISRARFEQLNEMLFKNTIEIVKECLADAKLIADEIDEVVLVGGSSKIPKLQSMLGDIFDIRKINRGVNPDEAVALGAAIYAHNLIIDHKEILDITSLSLGTNTVGDVMSVIIPRNSKIPAQGIKKYVTVYDDQTQMEFPIYQGEKSVASQNFELGNFLLSNLREGPAKSVVVEALFEIDADGILHVTATETNQENVNNIVIDVEKVGLSQDEINARLKELEENTVKEKEKLKLEKEKYFIEILLHEVQSLADTKEVNEKREIMNTFNEISNWIQNLSINDEQNINSKKQILNDIIAKNR